MSLLEDTIQSIKPQDEVWRNTAKDRLKQLAIPDWSLGRLMDLALDLAGITCSMNPKTQRKTIVTMAGDHGVVEEGVSLFPKEVTIQMVNNFICGGAGINALSSVVGARVIPVDMGVDADLSSLVKAGKLIDGKVARSTANFRKGPAMTREQAVQALEQGIKIANNLSDTTDVYGTGDMGIGNTTPSSAIVSVLTGCDVELVTGRGTGVQGDQLTHKIQVIRDGIARNKPTPSDGVDVLSKVGGFEIGGIAGLILGAAALRKPIVVDGFISTAGALIAQAIHPCTTDYIVCAHKSVEPGHQLMMKKLGKEPMLDLHFRLGEGTGAAVAMHLLDHAVAVLTKMFTFKEAEVSHPEEMEF